MFEVRLIVCSLLLGVIISAESKLACDNEHDHIMHVNNFQYDKDFWLKYILAVELLNSNKHTADDAVSYQTVTRDSINLTRKEKCLPVGAFCTYHEQCCSRACPGYYNKCMSR